jgi:hypothetical protein
MDQKAIDVRPVNGLMLRVPDHPLAADVARRRKGLRQQSESEPCKPAFSVITTVSATIGQCSCDGYLMQLN